MLTRDTLSKLCPDAKPEYLDAFTGTDGLATLDKYGINAPARLTAFLANVCEETGGMTIVRENMSYTTAQRIAAVWPSRFSVSSALGFVKQPQKLADSVYDGRLGNKASSSDGYVFRGGGPLQATGRDFYAFLQARTGIPFADDPTAIENPANWVISACVTWTAHPSAGDLNKFADAGNFKACCNGINRGNPYSTLDPIGWSDRQHWFKAWGLALPASTSAPAPASQFPLKDGSPKSPLIKDLQDKLKELGYGPATADGIFGPRTTRAVLSFQDRNALPTTGIVDERTFALLHSSDALPFPPSNAQIDGIAALRAVGDPNVVSADKQRGASVAVLAGSGIVAAQQIGALDAALNPENLHAISDYSSNFASALKAIMECMQFGAQHLYWVFGLIGGAYLWWSYATKIRGIKNAE